MSTKRMAKKSAPVENAGKKRIGRPPGKRTDPNYRQVSAWIRRATYDQVSVKLIQQERREFSDLVETLLTEWLQQNIDP